MLRKLQNKIALQVFIVGLLLSILGFGVHKKIISDTSSKKALYDIQSLSQELALSTDTILREKANKVQTLSSAPVIENLLINSNASFSSLSIAERENLLTDLNEQWIGEEDPNSAFIQSYMKNPAAVFLQKQLGLNPDEYGEIFITNRFGALVATTGKLTTLAHAKKYWWKESFNAGKGKLYFDDRGIDASVGGCVLGIVVPIKKNGQIIGILKSNILIQRVLSKVVGSKQLNLFRKNETLKHSHVMRAIVRKGGKIVTQPGLAPLTADISPQIKLLLSEQETGALVVESAGIKTFAAFSQIPISRGDSTCGFGGSPKSIDHIGGNQNEDWNIVVTQPAVEAMQLINQSNKLLYMIVVVLTAMLAVLALLIGRWITKPISALTDATKKIGQGDFTAMVEPQTSHDELEEVARSFNQMVTNLTESQEALQSAERRLNVALKMGNAGAWGYKIDNDEILAAAEGASIYGFPPVDGAIPIEVIESCIPERERVHKALVDLINEEHEYNLEFTINPIDGSPSKVIRSTARLEKDEQGNPLEVFGFVQDITEQKQSEEKRLKLEEQLRQSQKMEAIGTMAGGVAHNFNNSLAIILGNLELSKRKLTPQSKIEKYLDSAKTAAIRSSDLVKQIMTYSRKGGQSQEPLQLSRLLNEAITLLKPTIPSNVKLQQEIKPNCDQVYIQTDASQIQECLLNLCNNAVHAMKEKGELLLRLERVELRQQDIRARYDCSPGEYLCLSIQDNGCGIPDEIQEKIFDPFFSTKELYDGTGMGLSTVQGIVKQHHGMITVESGVGQGTTFHLYFPVVNQPEKEEVADKEVELQKGTERILLVDDDEMVVNLNEQLLSEMGYQVTAKTDSVEALKLFSANVDSYDLVITDQIMPESTGVELIQKIKKLRPEIPTILCTGYSKRVNEEEARQMGISAFLFKPTDLMKMSQVIRDVLAKN